MQAAIEQMTDTDLIKVLALSDDPQEMAAARQELNDRCFGPVDVDAEVERFAGGAPEGSRRVSAGCGPGVDVMKWNGTYSPGTERVVTKFLLLPRKKRGVWRWLETATWNQWRGLSIADLSFGLLG